MWKTSLYNTPKTTIELREIIESGVDIWDFEFPVGGFNTNQIRPVEFMLDFKKRFEDHFWFRQIGFETVGRFKHYLKTKVCEIMPYYYDLYNSAEIMKDIEDPFGNVNITETFSEISKGSSQGTSTGAGKTTNTASENSQSNGSSNSSTFGTEISSDTPQGEISNIERFMTNAKKNDNGHDSIDEHASESSSESESNSESSSDSSASSENEITRTINRKGNHGVNTYAHDMLEYRQILFNIYDMMFKDLNCLFLGVY